MARIWFTVDWCWFRISIRICSICNVWWLILIQLKDCCCACTVLFVDEFTHIIMLVSEAHFVCFMPSGSSVMYFVGSA